MGSPLVSWRSWIVIIMAVCSIAAMPPISEQARAGLDLNITSIRNHLVGEHPQSIFVRVWGQGTAADLAKGLRYALDVEVGATRPSAER